MWLRSSFVRLGASRSRFSIVTISLRASESVARELNEPQMSSTNEEVMRRIGMEKMSTREREADDKSQK